MEPVHQLQQRTWRIWARDVRQETSEGGWEAHNKKRTGDRNSVRGIGKQGFQGISLSLCPVAFWD